MKKFIFSKIIGKLKQDDNFPNCWKSEEIEISFFDNEKLTITFMDFEPESNKTFIDEADQVLANFLKLNTDDRNLISELAYKNCMDFLDAVEYDEADEPLRQIKNKHEIWNFIQPINIFIIKQLYKEQGIYVQVNCKCDWEQEHGLQLEFKQGKKLTNISN